MHDVFFTCKTLQKYTLFKASIEYIKSKNKSKNEYEVRSHPVGKEHKKALVVIFSLLFACLTVATIFITVELQHIGIASILMVAGVILAMDIFWVLRSKNDPKQI